MCAVWRLRDRNRDASGKIYRMEGMDSSDLSWSNYLVLFTSFLAYHIPSVFLLDLISVVVGCDWFLMFFTWLRCDVTMRQVAFKFEVSVFLALIGFTLLPQVFLFKHGQEHDSTWIKRSLLWICRSLNRKAARCSLSYIPFAHARKNYITSILIFMVQTKVWELLRRGTVVIWMAGGPWLAWHCTGSKHCGDVL